MKYYLTHITHAKNPVLDLWKDHELPYYKIHVAYLNNPDYYWDGERIGWKALNTLINPFIISESEDINELLGQASLLSL